ncbi:MAG: hypothetical protein ACK5PG_05890 [Lysobacterales bacterium]|jgi:hypothetical protein
MQWIDYSEDLWHRQPLPPERRHVLVQVAARLDKGMPPAVAVGYMKFAAGCKDSPRFIVPGVGGPVVSWCDCLGDDFHAPLWAGTHKQGVSASNEGEE